MKHVNIRLDRDPETAAGACIGALLVLVSQGINRFVDDMASEE